MKLHRLIMAALFALAASPVAAVDGLVAVRSTLSAKETMDRFEAAAKERGLNIFARIDHASGATKIGRTLRATELLVFGNPQGGTPLMECAQTAGIDLPLKALVWEDDKGQVWLGYNDPAYLARRHGAPSCPAATALTNALAALAKAGTTR